MKILNIENGYRLLERGKSASPPMRYLGPTKYEWSVSGNCERPLWRELTFRPDEKQKAAGVVRMFNKDTGKCTEWGVLPGLTIHIEARCRKCDCCRELRAYMWRMKAEREIYSAPRTWFSTFTVSPPNRFNCDNACRVKLAEQGIDFDTLSASDQFKERTKWVGEYITRYLKRLRKQTGAKIRYFIVAEAHKDGWPHYHALFHQSAGLVTERALRLPWTLGHSQHKLVSAARAAAYLCKYLAKSVLARIRASIRYGTEGPQTLFRLAMPKASVTTKNPLQKEEGEPFVKSTFEETVRTFCPYLLETAHGAIQPSPEAFVQPAPSG